MTLSPELLTPARTGEAARLAPQLQRIVAPNPGPLTGPGTNTYVLGTGATHIVIDPGPADAAHVERIVAAAAGRIVYVLCTHSHTDHSPGAAMLARRTGAPVHGRPAPTDDYQDETYAPEATIADGDVYAVPGATVRALHTPGHASNHVCFLLEPEGWLVTGDHLMSGSTVVILPPDGSMRAYLESLRRLRTLPLAALVPGHGAVMPDAHGEIDRVIAHRLKREAKVIEALRRQGPVATLETLVPEVYDDTPVALHGFARFSLLAHLQKLDEEGRVARDGDHWAWRGA
ncbi:MAG TPA: MBL fold metallo-hydrolase [Steroidobacteraceae bacterium]|nr:MBL fold metallo-hydrolase [Steroidobacteraceae bacterium]